jgi:hypothetical protein
MIPVTYSARVDTLTMPIVIIGGRSAGVLHPRFRALRSRNGPGFPRNLCHFARLCEKNRNESALFRFTAGRDGP